MMVERGKISALLRADLHLPERKGFNQNAKELADILYAVENLYSPLTIAESQMKIPDIALNLILKLMGKPTYSEDSWLLYSRDDIPYETFLGNETRQVQPGFALVYINKGIIGATIVGTTQAKREDLEHMLNLIHDNIVDEREGVFFPTGVNPEDKKGYINRNLVCLAVNLGFISAITGAVAVSLGIPSMPVMMATGGTGAVICIRNIILAASLGKESDNIREEHIPDLAYTCLYGEEARNAILAENADRKRNEELASLYRMLQWEELVISREAHVELYDGLHTLNGGHHLCKAAELDPRVAQIGIENLAPYYSR